MHYNYRLLLELGYESNGKLPVALKLMQKIEEEKLLNWLTSSEPQQEQRMLYTTLLAEIHQLLLEEQLAWPKFNKKPFLVEAWSWSLQLLEKFSLFYIIRTWLLPKDYTRGNYRFVDRWLLFHTILAISYVVLAGMEIVPSWVKYTLLIYGCLRMFEILIYQLNVILVHPYNNANYSLNSYRRMTIALIHNFFEIIFWFAGTFVTLQFIADATVPLAVYTSFTHMVTYSMELDDSKWSVIAVMILQFQALIGVFMTILSLARFVSLFPQPASQDPREQEANEQRHVHLIHKLNELEGKINENTNNIKINRRDIEGNAASKEE